MGGNGTKQALPIPIKNEKGLEVWRGHKWAGPWESLGGGGSAQTTITKRPGKGNLMSGVYTLGRNVGLTVKGDYTHESH